MVRLPLPGSEGVPVSCLRQGPKMSGDSVPEVTFTLKNPSKSDAEAFKLTVPVSATIADIQRRIAAEYDGNPSPKLQTVGAVAAA